MRSALRTAAKFVWLLPLCSLCVACSSVQRPTASIRSANLGDVTARGFVLNFDLDLQNPNSVPLPLGDADYALSLGGVKVIDDTAKPEGSIPANGSLGVRLPVTVSFDSLLKAEKAIRASGGDIPYEFEGALDFSQGGLGGMLPGGATRVPLRYSGTLPLKRILSDPEALLNSPAAQRLAGKVLGQIFGR